MEDKAFSRRREMLRKTLVEVGLSALLVTKEENRIYLSGFHSTNCSLLITPEEDFLLTDFRYESAARQECPQFQVVILDNGRTVGDFLKGLSLSSLGVEEEVLTAGMYQRLSQSLAGARLIRADGLVEELRAVKDQGELDAIARAEALGDRCFSHMLEYLRPGLTEKEAALEIEFFLRKNGAQALSFDTICVSGERTSLPHGVPTDKVMEIGDLITMDFGCVVDGYCSDMTRTVCLGKAGSEERELYEIVLAAQLLACRSAVPGMSCFDLDKKVRDFIGDAGYGPCFGHGLGHGVGLEIHEAPTLNTRTKDVLKENMVITLEPGIYVPNQFGIRIEDLAFVSDSGIIIKANSPKELIIL